MWVEDIVNEIINKKPNKEMYVINTGTSVTGISHIGNFREVAVAYFVSRGLELKGKRCRVILSFDDFDRFKKVPYGVPESYSEYIGMPVCDIRSHIDPNLAFSEYYENLFKSELKLLGIENIDYVMQSKKYKAGDYKKYNEIIFDNADKIQTLVNENKLTDKNNLYFPFHIYCDRCNKDLIQILDIDKKNKTYKYKCLNCGLIKSFSVEESLKIKPIFKVDWPMRWEYENVDFEPSGKSHMTKGGAFDVSVNIFEKIFDKKCEVIAKKYEYVELESATNRMSKTSGKVLTIQDMLKYIDKKMLLWLFLKTPPNKILKIGTGYFILLLYDDFEKFICDKSQNAMYIKDLLEIDEKFYLNRPKMRSVFNQINSLMTDEEILNSYKNNNIDLDYIKRIRNLIQENNWAPKLLKNKNTSFYYNLNDLQKYYVSKFYSYILENDINEININAFFSDNKIEKEQFKEFYSVFYNLLFGTSSGPPFKRIFSKIDISKIIKLLEF